MTVSSLSLLWFLAILALIPLTLWLLKRGTPGNFFHGAANAPVRMVATLPLGPQQRIVTIETGQGEQRQWLVLGVTPSSITTLHTLPAQALPTSDGTPGSPAFATLLSKLQGPKS